MAPRTSAVLFVALLLVWVLRVRISWESAGPQWGYTFVVHHYAFRTIPDLMVGVPSVSRPIGTG